MLHRSIVVGTRLGKLLVWGFRWWRCRNGPINAQTPSTLWMWRQLGLRLADEKGQGLFTTCIRAAILTSI
ncbi:hypothetical protein FF1_000533 [Malus domestica]